MGFNYIKATEPLLGDILLFIAKCSGVTHLIKLKINERLSRPSGFEPRTPGLGIQCLNHWAIARI